nr:hypothetical protein [Ectobacillus panaciterrae]
MFQSINISTPFFFRSNWVFFIALCKTYKGEQPVEESLLDKLAAAEMYREMLFYRRLQQ